MRKHKNCKFLELTQVVETTSDKAEESVLKKKEREFQS